MELNWSLKLLVDAQPPCNTHTSGRLKPRAGMVKPFLTLLVLQSSLIQWGLHNPYVEHTLPEPQGSQGTCKGKGRPTTEGFYCCTRPINALQAPQSHGQRYYDAWSLGGKLRTSAHSIKPIPLQPCRAPHLSNHSRWNGWHVFLLQTSKQQAG